MGSVHQIEFSAHLYLISKVIGCMTILYFILRVYLIYGTKWRCVRTILFQSPVFQFPQNPTVLVLDCMIRHHSHWLAFGTTIPPSATEHYHRMQRGHFPGKSLDCHSRVCNTLVVGFPFCLAFALIEHVGFTHPRWVRLLTGSHKREQALLLHLHNGIGEMTKPHKRLPVAK